MPVTQTANPPSFESVWALLQENAQGMKELRESQKELRESQKETDRQLKETERILKEDSKRQKEEFDKRIGALTNLFGDVTEAMIAPKICEKFEEFGFNFPRANPNVRFNDRVNKISFEVDIMLENGDKAMLIEAKTKLTIERINYHINRMEKMHKYANLHGDKRIFLGAVAGVVVTDEVRDYALNQGFYFIEYAGENFYITPPNGKPEEW
jgi:DNA repair exonuclease SbcCD ATPase subunit